ncbi:MAG: sulfatase [Candidatus Omnitrophica bacterium]|nr:sulfatase [Candidatus Omnitrophota bacterium]
MKILIIDIDTLRAGHLGCYGYHRNTSPNIDKIASDGIIFTNYHCSDAPCLPSRAALITGKHGIHTGVINHSGRMAEMFPEGKGRGFTDRLRYQSLWGMLAFNKYHTTSISTFAGRHGAWWFHAGLNEVFDIGLNGMESAHDVTFVVLDWIEKNAEKDNWVLHINYWDPHTPYRTPENFNNPFVNEPLPEWITEETVEKWKQCVGGHSALDYGMFSPADVQDRFPKHPAVIDSMESARKMIDGYDCGIRYVDIHTGIVLDALASKKVDDLAIIITSDHGENLGELGCCSEHGTSDYITHRIPLIIKWPGYTNGPSVDDGLHYNIDLLPTIAEMLGIKFPDSIDGISFAQAIKEGKNCGREYLVLSQCCHGCQRSVRWKDYIYIRTYHDFYHLYPDEMLFNIKQDPNEQNNLASQLPGVCAEATHLYLKWHDEMMKKSPYPVDPLWLVLEEGGPFHSRGKLKDYCRRLEETNRSWAIEELKKRHPQEFK